MLNADVLTFQEFVTREPLILSRIHGSILEYLSGREGVILSGVHAVNAYVSEPRMTQAVKLLSVRSRELAEELRSYLSEKFQIAVKVREIKEKGFRVYQVRKEGNRHLVDIRQVTEFPDSETIENIRVLSPAELIASKVISFQSRYGNPKSWSDRRDLAMLLLRFPKLKTEDGEVGGILTRRGVDERILEVWRETVAQDLEVEGEDDDLNF